MEESALAPSDCAHLWRPRELDAYLGAYDIGTVQSSDELAGGMFLRPLLIRTDRGSYVLRRHSFRGNARSFRFQAEVIAGAADRGVRCPRIVRRKDGRWGAPLDGAYCALHEYAPGHVLDWRTWAARKRDCPDFLRRLGEHVAALHNALDRMNVGGSPGLALWLPPIRFHRLAACRRHFDRSVETMARSRTEGTETARALSNPTVCDAWNSLLQASKRLRADRLPMQIVHGDVSPVNLVWNDPVPSGRDAPTFIDWDCAHVGIRLYDALGDVLLRAPGDRPECHRFDPDEVRAYLRGYSAAIRMPLSSAETRCVPMFLLARQLEDLRQRAAVAAGLTGERDAEYAELVRMRTRIMRQLRPYVDEEKGPCPWT